MICAFSVSAIADNLNEVFLALEMTGMNGGIEFQGEEMASRLVQWLMDSEGRSNGSATCVPNTVQDYSMNHRAFEGNQHGPLAANYVKVPGSSCLGVALRKELVQGHHCRGETECIRRMESLEILQSATVIPEHRSQRPVVIHPRRNNM